MPNSDDINFDHSWQKTYSKIVHFMTILWCADLLETSDVDITSITDYLNRPSHFQNEHEIWESCGFPEYGDGDWDHFITLINGQDVTVED